MKTPTCDNASLLILNKDIGLSLAVAFSDPHAEKKATHFKKKPDRLVLATCGGEGFTPLMVPLGAEEAAPMVTRWLEEEAQYPKDKPYNDGDIWHEKGWKVFTNQWGFVDGDHNAFVAIEPVWALIGK